MRVTSPFEGLGQATTLLVGQRAEIGIIAATACAVECLLAACSIAK
eukprot:CAMPEP_0180821294 /NCGR_PEP_ID=MMETSP1038_2-20121128/70753_1 /TAXON_ID=632150 /ORGANISM="Azadinium spinosum, Strain 3D9" /LENGTH=45 /DNA_ID= /DNA_START= /DNA_END= /DNA_ORIENTATION=